MKDANHRTTHLIGQFLLANAEQVRAADDWLADTIGCWCLRRDAALPAIRLVGPEEEPIGWVLGYPISAEGRLLTDSVELHLSADETESDSAVERVIYAFGGRFAVVVITSRMARFYLDALGSLSAVYCAHQRIVASTPGLIPYDDKTADRVHLAKAMGIPLTSAMYPLGLTPRCGIDRILPNHYLDLDSWKVVRHWPTQPLCSTSSPEEAIPEIVSIVKRNIAAVASDGTARLALTAGRDSRSLLACARAVADNVELFTAEIPDEDGKLDCEIAGQIANRFGLKHRVLPTEAATEQDLQDWMSRIAFSTGEFRGWQAATMFKRLGKGYGWLLKGVPGGLERSYFSYPDDTETTVIPPERLLAHCLCPPYEEPLAWARNWLRTVPVADSFQILDFFFLEQRAGCWAGIWPYAECGYGVVLFPMCHRRVVERMLTLPLAYRRSRALMQDIIAREWPELLEWPFNAAVGTDRLRLATKALVEKAKAAFFHPGWALGRLHDRITDRPQWQRQRRWSSRRPR